LLRAGQLTLGLLLPLGGLSLDGFGLLPAAGGFLAPLHGATIAAADDGEGQDAQKDKRCDDDDDDEPRVHDSFLPSFPLSVPALPRLR
jgi:hypothetical protein